jgi:broad specificity phosphatase PhoE
MAMPIDLVFVRHGQSEANIVQRADKDRRPHDMAEQVNNRPDWEQRLSPLGIQQARKAKEWIDRNLGGAGSFDFRYFSPFLRTRETAAYIGGPDCGGWIIEDRVVERSWGIFGTLPRDQRKERFDLTVAATPIVWAQRRGSALARNASAIPRASATIELMASVTVSPLRFPAAARMSGGIGSSRGYKRHGASRGRCQSCSVSERRAGARRGADAGWTPDVVAR